MKYSAKKSLIKRPYFTLYLVNNIFSSNRKGRKGKYYFFRKKRIYLLKIVVKTFWHLVYTKWEWDENFNARIKLFQNSNCFIFKHYFLSPVLRRNTKMSQILNVKQIQRIQNWGSSLLIGWSLESESNKYAERVLIGLISDNEKVWTNIQSEETIMKPL